MKILLNSPTSIATNFINIFNQEGVELHVITRTDLVKHYENIPYITKVFDITKDIKININKKYINDFEIPDDLPIWLFVEYDRILQNESREKTLLLSKHHCIFSESILSMNDYNFIVGEIAGLQHSILQWYAEKRNLKYIWPSMSYWDNRFFICHGGANALDEHVKRTLSHEKINNDNTFENAEVINYISRIKSFTPKMPHVIKHEELTRFHTFQFILSIPRLTYKMMKLIFARGNTYLDSKILNILNTNYIYKFLNSFSYHKYFREVINSNENYVLYFLQYEPDLSILVQAPHFKNQIELIRNIAFNLPNDFVLYVKEHPLNAFTRSPAFYKKLNTIPNIKLISHKVENNKIIKNSSAITTITGSVGWEALIHGIPVITFGNVFYNNCAKIFHCTDVSDLRTTIKKAIDSKKSKDDKELTNFITKIYALTYPGDYYRTITHSHDKINNALVYKSILEYASV